MAEEYVSKDQFAEFIKRMEQGFEQVNQRLDDLRAEMQAANASIREEMRAANASIQAEMRASDANIQAGMQASDASIQAEMRASYASLQAEMRANNANIQAEMRQMRNWLIGLYGIVVFGFIGSIFLTIIKQTVP